MSKLLKPFLAQHHIEGMNQPPPGHNADVSMLSGGTESIVGVMGGGRRVKKGTRAKKGSLVKKTSRAKKARRNMKGGQNVLTIIQQPPHKVKLTLNTPIEKVANGDAANIVKNYVTKQTALWKRQATTGSINDASKIITTSSCAASTYDHVNGDKGQSGSDRLGCILPENIHQIIVIPPIYGNYLTYTACINTIQPNLTDASAVILFSPPLFSGKDISGNPAGHSTVNRDIFLHFLNMKATSAATIYYLAEYTQNSIYNGCDFTAKTTQTHIVPLLEPSYVLYPYVRKMGDKNYSGLIFSAAASDEVLLPASASSSKLGVIGAAQIIDDVNGGFVAFPPNTKREDSLLNKGSIPYKQYRFLVNYSNAAYLLDSTNISINVFIMKDGFIPVIAPTYKDGDKFKKSSDAFITGVNYSTIPLGVKQYSLRHPRTLEVVNDWKNLVFTEAEVDFLNDLNLRPDILDDLYAEKYNGRSWRADLATNLATIVRSKCFSDNRLVLHSSCQASQKFITDILEFFVEHDSRIKALENNEMEAENNRLKLTLDSKLAAAAAAAATGMDKDPIADKLVFRTGQAYASRFNINYTPIEEIKGRVYSRSLIIYNKTAQTHDVVKLICSAPECTNMQDATKYLEGKYRLLKTEYPNYMVGP